MKNALGIFILIIYFSGISFAISNESKEYLKEIKDNEDHERANFISKYQKYFSEEFSLTKEFTLSQYKAYKYHETKLVSHFKAIEYAVQCLESIGFKKILIKKMIWCVAPGGDYVIVGIGDLKIDGKVFSKFKVIVCDGSDGRWKDAKNSIGVEAKGFDENGKPFFVYFPEDSQYGDIIGYEPKD